MAEDPGHSRAVMLFSLPVLRALRIRLEG